MPLSKAEYKRLVLRLSKLWERQLDAGTSRVLARQIKEYEKVSASFDALIKSLVAKSKGLSKNQIFRLEQYKVFKEEVAKQLTKYAEYNAGLTTVAQKEFAQFGLKNSNTLLGMIQTNINNKLPIAAINKTIGLTNEGSPLYGVFQKRFSERADEAVDILIRGVSKGSNPAVIAREMGAQLDITKYDATRIARTEVINTYNQVSYDNYKNSGIVDSYLFIAESDACEECLAIEANAPYPLTDTDKVPAIHPHCRCTIAPDL